MKLSRVFNILMALAMVAAAMPQAIPAAAQGATPVTDFAPGALFVPGEVIVSFAAGEAPSAYAAQAAALAGDVGAQVADMEGNLALLSFAEDADVEALAAQISASGLITASPNYIGWIPEAQMTPLSGTRGRQQSIAFTGSNGQRMTVSATALRSLRSGIRGNPTYPVETTQPLSGDSWGWYYSNANVVWMNTAASPTVCLIDTGVDGLNSDLAGKITNGKDFVNEDLIPNDDNGHGTHVAGIMIANAINKKGISGVSNGKIVAVKAFAAQGWGTTFDLIEALNACALNTGIKIINLSASGFPYTSGLYNAIDNAVNAKGKLLVVSAGNDSTSDITYNFPAAWAAQFVCANGTLAPNFGTSSTPDCASPNTVYQRVISVGAGYDTNSYEFNTGGWDGGDSNPEALLPDYWVDTDGDGVWLSSEDVAPELCLASYSNYGPWVNMIAPGSWVYSSLPISYPYYNAAADDLDGVADGFGYMSGTSMAAPFVSGAAARVWSINTLWTASQIKTKLINDARPLPTESFATDGSVPVGMVADGYNGTREELEDPGPQVWDPNTGYGGEIPYCVPDESNNYGEAQNMSGDWYQAVVYLDVARAMDRFAIIAYVNDAINGLPLTAATVQAYQGASLKDTATVGKVTNMVHIINLPTTSTLIPTPTYSVKVTKSGYTTAATIQAFLDIPAVLDQDVSAYYTDPFLRVSVPPLGRMSLVVDWDAGNAADGFRDLDLYTFLPFSATPATKVIGNPFAGDTFYRTGVDHLTNPFGGIDAGTLYTPPLGSMPPNFKTRWNHDGGSAFYQSTGVESVSMMPNAAAATNPFWNTVGSSNKYEFFLTDYGAAPDSIGGFANDSIVVRFWRGGFPVAAYDNFYAYALDTTLPFAYRLDESNVCTSGDAKVGSIDVLEGSTAVTGTGTSFTDAVVGDYMIIEGVLYKIAAIGSNTSLTLDVPYAGADASGLDFMLFDESYWIKIGRIGSGTSAADLAKFYLDDGCAVGDPKDANGGNTNGGFPY